jgi:large subunit ribosomal protein L21
MSTDYAVFVTGGKQYRVRPGDTIEIERLEGEAGSAVEFSDVLLTSVAGAVTVGKPTVSGAKVTAEITGQLRGPKVITYKYGSKTRRRNIKGHRQSLTAVNIKEIAGG